MNVLKEIKKELQEKKKLDVLTRSRVVLLEQAKFKDLIAISPKCEKCERQDKLTIDHIIPKQMLPSFGIDPTLFFDENNLRVLCQPCNHFKGGQLDFSTLKTRELIMKYMPK